jgi:hypothetical protein
MAVEEICFYVHAGIWMHCPEYMGGCVDVRAQATTCTVCYPKYLTRFAGCLRSHFRSKTEQF